MAAAIPWHDACGKGARDSTVVWMDDTGARVLIGGTRTVSVEVDGDGQ
jgi:hypothetical protein